MSDTELNTNRKLRLEVESLRQQLGDVFDEKKILSQRVRELEEENAALESGISYEVAIRVKLEEELDALKESQGEPVGEVVASVVSESALAAIRWIDDNYTPKVGDKLYTAPTIPEGWLQRGKDALESIRRTENLCDDDELLERLLKAMFDAAPKPEDV